MSQGEPTLEVQLARLSPAEAELHLFATGVEGLQGRVTGPRCLYSTTIEVAYPLRPLSGGASGSARVVIPEPCPWDPTSPFLYRAVVRPVMGGTLGNEGTLRFGMRRLQRGTAGPLWNGRPLDLACMACAGLTAEEAQELRRTGVNALVAPVAAAEVWELADVHGFVVLGRLTGWEEVTLARELRGHPCCLGWLVPGDGAGCEAELADLRGGDGLLVGTQEPAGEGDFTAEVADGLARRGPCHLRWRAGRTEA